MKMYFKTRNGNSLAIGVHQEDTMKKVANKIQGKGSIKPIKSVFDSLGIIHLVHTQNFPKN